MDYRKQFYKNAHFNSKEQARIQRSETLFKARKEDRMNILQSRRNLAQTTPEARGVTKEKLRAEKLAKWKAEKQKAIAELKKKQKPVFKVGIVQKKATGSPLIKMTSTYATKNFLNPQQLSKINHSTKSLNKGGVMTRAKARALQSENLKASENIQQVSGLSQIIGNRKKNIVNHTFTVPKSVADLSRGLKITFPQSPQQILKDKRNIKQEINDPVPAKGKKKQFKGRSATKSAKQENFHDLISNDDVKENINNEIDDENEKKSANMGLIFEKNLVGSESAFVPIHYSPFVNKSRGSKGKSPRKGKINLSLDVDSVIEKEENEIKCRIFSFRKYIEGETKKLLDASDFWKSLMKDCPTIPEFVQEEILSLCGKTTLLTSDKFMQFRVLVDKCENKDPMVKVEDLQGYQDWVSIEVENLDRAFQKLEEMRANNWQENQKKELKCQSTNEQRPRRAKKIEKHQGIRSNIREHIQALRELKQNGVEMIPKNKLNSWLHKTPEKQSSLLKEVLHSETKRLNSPARLNSSKVVSGTKKRVSGMEITAATQIGKMLTPREPSSVKKIIVNESSDVNESTTPLKSILKQTASPYTTKNSVHFTLTRNSSCGNAGGLNEKYFEPLIDDEEYSDSPIRMGDFALKSPTVRMTPLRKSQRLAQK